MKRIVLYIALIGLFSTGCSDFLVEENKSDVISDEYYETAEGFETLVNSSYGTLRDVYGGNPYIFCAGTDMYVEGREPQPPGLSEYRFLSPAEEEAGTLYFSGFQSIQICNMGLYYSDKVEEFDELDNRIGELKYLRANYFFLLVQTYGGVTLTTDFVNSPILAFERNSAEEVYEFIVKELEEAKNLVSTEAYNGRVNKRAVLHLLAKVYMTRGYESFAGSDDFSKAATYADEAIDGQALNIAFEDLWTPGNDENAEVLVFGPVRQGFHCCCTNRIGKYPMCIFWSIAWVVVPTWPAGHHIKPIHFAQPCISSTVLLKGIAGSKLQ